MAWYSPFTGPYGDIPVGTSYLKRVPDLDNTDDIGTASKRYKTTYTVNLAATNVAGDLTDATGLPISTGVTGMAAGMATFLATPTSANLKAVTTDETGSAALVFANTPTLVTPILGTPTSGNLSNCTAYPTAQLSGLGTGVATFLATPSSANLAAAVTDETGSAALVFANTPTLVTPILGTPTSGDLSNCTSFPTAQLSGLGSGVATFLATPSSANLSSALTTKTGTGNAVFATNPTFSGITMGSAAGNIDVNGNAVVNCARVDATAAQLFLGTAAPTLGVNIGQSGTTNTLNGTNQLGTTLTVSAGGAISNASLVSVVLGTPASGTLTNCNGLPVSGISDLGTGVATFLATPSSANLNSALTTKTGSGNAVFATSPALTTPTITSGETHTGSNLSGLNSVINIDSTFADGNYIAVGGGGRNIGVLSGGDFFLSANADYNATSNVYKYNATAGCTFIELNATNGLLRYAASGTAGNTATPSSAISWDLSGNVSTATGNLTIDTAGKTLKIKQGSNACSGTGAVLSGGTVTVNTTAVATGDTILLSCTAAGGTQGIPRISAISNGTSFTITSSQGTDTSTYSWIIIKAA